MKTPASQYLLAFGLFAVTALATFWAISGSGAFLKSTPYQTRDSSADAELARLTGGAGAAILDGVVARVKAKAEAKWGTPLNVAAYNAHLDSYLALVDRIDNTTRTQVGPGYASIFQYIYPRVYELRKAAGAGQVSGTQGQVAVNPGSNGTQVTPNGNQGWSTPWNGGSNAVGNAQDASDFSIRYADGAIEFKIDKKFGYLGCIMTFWASKEQYSVNGTQVTSSFNAMEMWLGASNVWGAFIGKRFVWSGDAAMQQYVNLYCSKTLAPNGGILIPTAEKVIPSMTVREIQSNPINAISISRIPWN